jgi:uncharacterized protein (TIGR03067 family)
MMGKQISSRLLSMGLVTIIVALGCSGSQTGKGTESSSSTSQGTNSAQSDKEDDNQNDAELLQGTWRCVSYEYEGHAQDMQDQSVQIEKDAFTMKLDNRPVVLNKFTFDPSKKPKTIDLTVVKALNDSANGKKQLGIYKVNKDTLTWCTAMPGMENRPKEFNSGKKGDRLEVWVYKREK